MDRNSDYTVLIPAAGVSKRFKDAGIEQPKHEIEFYWNVTDKRCSMLEHVMMQLRRINTEIVVGVRELPGEYLEGVTYVKTGDTAGQADTVLRLSEYVGQSSKPVLVLNCDAAFSYPLSVFLSQCQGARLYDCPILAGALVVDGCGNPAYSYVDKFPLFYHAAEKQMISPWAMTGAYYFHNNNLLRLGLSRFMRFGRHYAHEAYLSGLFGDDPFSNSMAVYMPRTQWHVWGTPEDLAYAQGVRQFDPEVHGKLVRVVE